MLETSEQRVPRRVVAAALKLHDGRILVGVRHFDEIMRSWLPSKHGDAVAMIKGHEQGFVDNYYQFMDRTEAYNVAVEQNQLLTPFVGIKGSLCSEDLW